MINTIKNYLIAALLVAVSITSFITIAERKKNAKLEMAVENADANCTQEILDNLKDELDETLEDNRTYDPNSTITIRVLTED